MNWKTMKNTKTKKTTMLLAVFILLGWLFGLSTQASAQQYSCFPTCEHDGRFLVLDGSGLETLSGAKIIITVSAPASAETVGIGIFDGETGQNWDRGSVQSVYTLYADPKGDNTGTLPVGSWTGDQMVNNDWFIITFDPRSEPFVQGRSPSLSYFYRLEITNPNPSQYSSNAFKIRTSGQVTMAPQAFSYIVPVATPGTPYLLQDFQWIYPNLQTLSPWVPQSETRYDGRFGFHFYIPGSSSFVAIWDGDMDHGGFISPLSNPPVIASADTDDPDTPNDRLPPWASGTSANYEGAAVGLSIYGVTASGDPADDTYSQPALRSPSVYYTVLSPDGQLFENPNPSGNREWEQFRIDSNAANPADYQVTEKLPGGLYHVHIVGLDINNLNAFRFMYDAVGVCEKGEGDNESNPCKPLLHPYKIGDTVWIDTNRSGSQESGEVGRPGVVVHLLDSSFNPVLDIFGNPITAITDVNGYYEFQVEGKKTAIDPLTGQEIEIFDGVYKVQVGTENFDCTPGSVGALCGLVITNLAGPQIDLNNKIITYTVIDTNVLDYDFGFYLLPGGSTDTGTIGDKVWWDYDGDGIQDANEPGIGGVKLTLGMDWNRDGFIDATLPTTTASDGSYHFINLILNSKYTVTVDASNFTSGALVGFGLSPTLAGNDRSVDSNANPSTITLPLVGGSTQDLSIDFGYSKQVILTGGIGNFVWHDLGIAQTWVINGVQDANEPGIPGVVVELRDASRNVLATKITDASGFYHFTGLQAGSYIVKIADSNFGAGGVLAGWFASPLNGTTNTALDSNGGLTSHEATVTLPAGYDDLTIDFGFYKTCIKLDKTGPTSPVDSGQSITYTFRVENCGDLVLHGGAHVYDPLINPSGDHEIWWDVVWPGEVKTIQKSYKTSTKDCGSLENNAWAIGHPRMPDGRTYKPNVRADSNWTVDVNCVQGGEGCTPGYWKQSQHYDSWVKYTPTGSKASQYNKVFSVPYYSSLLNALGAGGGGKDALARHASAALLNSVSPKIDYRYSEYEVIKMVQDAYKNGTYEATKNLLETENAKHCPCN
jgi:hypothetical protein